MTRCDPAIGDLNNVGLFLATKLNPGLRRLSWLGGPMVAKPAKILLLAIAGQESSWAARYQNAPSSSPGPARGFWQFEQGGGVHGVLTHAASKDLAAKVCESLDVAVNEAAVWRALEGSDLLAAMFARLLLWTDPYAVPTEQDAGWDCYLRLWRPGAPRPDDWPDNWAAAAGAVG